MKNIFLIRQYFYKFFKNTITKPKPNTVLHSFPINLESFSGTPVTINAVVRDGMPNGSDIGCVVAIHDIPGNDKSYLNLFEPLTKKGIRLIAVNLPGFGYSSYNKSLKCDINERILFIKSICKKILHSKEKTIFMGVGRGCETAIKIAYEYHKKGSVGCVAISPYGMDNDHLRDHTLLYSIHHLFSSLKIIGSHQLKPLLDIVYGFGKNYYYDVHMTKIRGSEATRRTIDEIDFSTLPPFLEGIVKQKQKFSIIYGTRNKKIKPEPSLSYMRYVPNCKYFNIDKGNEDITVEEIKNNYEEGVLNVVIDAKYSNHKIQKTHPEFIAGLCEGMLQSSELKIE